MGRGALVFKGDTKKKKKSKKKHLVMDDGAIAATGTITTTRASTVDTLTPSLPIVVPRTTPSSSTTQQLLKEGSGQITTSGTVVTGYDTRFEKELSMGDAIIVRIGEQQEMRVVTMRLGNISCAISSSFSSNIKQRTDFSIIHKPRDQRREALVSAQKEVVDKEEEEKQAFGTYGSTDELVYREVTEHGGYRIKRVKVEGQKKVTRSDLLSMRTKKKSDRYC